MEKKNSGGINIGTSSVLVTFVLLCLVTFASLAYMSARSDYKLSEQTAQRTKAYYEANATAELYMANIEGLLSKYVNTCKDEKEYKDGIEKLFDDNDMIVVKKDGDDVFISYEVTITEAQKLSVELIANYPDKDDWMLFHIDKWSTQIDNEYMNTLKDDSFDGKGTGLLF